MAQAVKCWYQMPTAGSGDPELRGMELTSPRIVSYVGTLYLTGPPLNTAWRDRMSKMLVCPFHPKKPVSRVGA